MATYTCKIITNKFKVNQKKMFKDIMENIFGFQVVETDQGEVQLFYDDLNSPPWEILKTDNVPQWSKALDTLDKKTLTIPQTIEYFLKEDEVVIYKEIGSEKLRYLIGFGFVINSEGDYKQINLGELDREAESM